MPNHSKINRAHGFPIIIALIPTTLKKQQGFSLKLHLQTIGPHFVYIYTKIEKNNDFEEKHQISTYFFQGRPHTS